MTMTKAAKAKRKAARQQRLTPRRNCPHPAKKAYKDDTALAVALRRSKASGRAMRIYVCACGSKHLTSKPMKGGNLGLVQDGRRIR